MAPAVDSTDMHVATAEPADSQKQTERIPVFPEPLPQWPDGTERITHRLISSGYAVVCDPREPQS